MIRTNNEILQLLLSNREIADMADVREVSFEIGESIISQERYGRKVVIIKSGLTKCYVEEDNGKEFIQEFFGKGQFIGEIEVLLGTKSFSNVVALTKVGAIEFLEKEFLLLMKEHPGFTKLLVTSLAIKLRDTAMRASFQQTHSTENTLIKLINAMRESEIEIEKRDISNYLGITKRALNRLLKQIEFIST